MKNKPAKLNRTIRLDKDEIKKYSSQSIKLTGLIKLKLLIDKVINQDLSEVINYLPENFVDLLFIDPPYNLTKKFNQFSFKEMNLNEYEDWLDSWLSKLKKIHKVI